MLFRRISWRSESGTLRKDVTTAGSKCDPEQRTISALAASNEMAFEYGRSKVIASKASTAAKMRAPSGISSARRPLG